MTTTPMALRPQEPVLDIAEIQGIALPGFFKPRPTLLYLQLPSASREVVDNFKAWLAGVAGQLATAARTLEDRRPYRRARVAPGRPQRASEYRTGRDRVLACGSATANARRR